VRLIGESGEQLGVLPLTQALQMANERDLDLVEVAPNVNPPVCRLLDYGKFRYEQAKKERQAHKHQKVVEVSQIRLRPGTDVHDVESKVRLAKRLLEKGNKVKILVIFRGRQIVHPELGRELLERVAKSLEGMAKVERPLLLEGRNMSLILAPGQKTQRGKVDAQA
jgi:translation initiation factor IF-3